MTIAGSASTTVAALADGQRQARWAAYRFESVTAIDRVGAVRALSAWLDYVDALPQSSQTALQSKVAGTRSLIAQGQRLNFAHRIDARA